MECIICFEPVYKSDLYIPECGCKYTAHERCIRDWNGTCILCDAQPPKSILRREMVIVFVCVFCILIIMARTIL